MPDLDKGGIVYSIAHPDFGAVIDGSTDDTSAVQDAINTASSAGGGIVYHPGGTSVVTQLKLKTNVTLAGTGWGSSYKQAGSTNLHVIILNDKNVERTVIRDLTVDGNKTQQTGGKDGIHFNNDTGSFGFGDPVHRISNVLITDVDGVGLHLAADCRESKVSDVYVNGADKDGYFVIATDSVVERCTSGSAGLAGFRCRGTNTRYLGCKSFGSGRVTASVGDGFMVDGDRSSLIGCEAQDNERHGFVLFNVEKCIISACDADSNGKDWGHGFRLDGSDHCIVEHCLAYNRPQKTTQDYGFEFANSPSGNRVEGIAQDNNSGDKVGSTSGNVVAIS